MSESEKKSILIIDDDKTIRKLINHHLKLNNFIAFEAEDTSQAFEILKKENYKKDICYVINYHPNGKIASTGKTRLVIKDDLAHWFYFDEWLFYDENGNYIETRTYNNGELMLNKSE